MSKKVLLFVMLVLMIVLASCGSYSRGTYNNLPSSYYNEEINYIDEFFGNEEYNDLEEYPFTNTSFNNTSYFSMDSFTAAYSNLRRFINERSKIPYETIKTDEMLNYFSYDLEEVDEDETFKVSAEMHTAPWNEDHQLITIGINTKVVEPSLSEGNNYVFLIDVSGSMSSSNKLSLIKNAFPTFLERLDPSDRISIVTYASGVNVVSEGLTAKSKTELIRKVNKLKATGSTNGEGDISKAYDIARKYYIEGGNNRVIIATDADFNVGITSQSALGEYIKEQAVDNIYLTCLGFGMGNYHDTTMETLAKNGNGGYAYIDSLEEAIKVLGEELTSTLVTVASDVKSGITFNPSIIKSYRLLGYENKGLTEEEFESEETNAGEIGSGHKSIVCYEVELYDEVINEDNLFDVTIKYKDPLSKESLVYERSFDKNSRLKNFEDFLFASSTIEFSLIIRSSIYMGNANYASLIIRLNELLCTKTDPYKKEFTNLVLDAYNYELTAVRYSSSSYYTIKLYTDYGYKNVLISRSSSLDSSSIIKHAFGEKADLSKYSIFYDKEFIKPYIAGQLFNGIRLYVRYNDTTEQIDYPLTESFVDVTITLDYLDYMILHPVDIDSLSIEERVQYMNDYQSDCMLKNKIILESLNVNSYVTKASKTEEGKKIIYTFLISDYDDLTNFFFINLENSKEVKKVEVKINQSINE